MTASDPSDVSGQVRRWATVVVIAGAVPISAAVLLGVSLSLIGVDDDVMVAAPLTCTALSVIAGIVSGTAANRIRRPAEGWTPAAWAGGWGFFTFLLGGLPAIYLGWRRLRPDDAVGEGVCAFCGRRPSVAAAGLPVAMHRWVRETTVTAPRCDWCRRYHGLAEYGFPRSSTAFAAAVVIAFGFVVALFAPADLAVKPPGLGAAAAGAAWLLALAVGRRYPWRTRSTDRFRRFPALREHVARGWALGARSSGASSVDLESVRSLTSAVGHADVAIRREAMGDLAVLCCMTHEVPPWRVPAQTTRDVWRMVIPAVRTACADGDPAVRSDAFEIATLFPLVFRSEPFISGISDPEPSVRRCAARALAGLAGMNDAGAAAALKARDGLIALAKQADGEPSLWAALAIHLVPAAVRRGVGDDTALQELRCFEAAVQEAVKGGELSADVVAAMRGDYTPRTAAMTLDAVYARHPDGFGRKSDAPDCIRRVGEALDRRGGFDLMLQAHREFAARCRIAGAARNVEFMWDGIGQWGG